MWRIYSKGLDVIGYDNNTSKVGPYRAGIDPTKEVGNDMLMNTTLNFTDDETKVQNATFIIVTVLTPVDDDHTPDLGPIEDASRLVGKN